MGKYTIYDFAQNSAEWQKIRIGKFTATDAYIIYKGGAALSSLIEQKLAEKLSNMMPAEVKTAAIDWGHEQEDIAAELYSQKMQIECSKVGFIKRSDYFGVSPDRVILNKKRKITKSIEIKCPQDTNFIKYLISILQNGINGIDPKHYAQMQAQMYAMNTKETDYVLYNPHFDRELFVQKVELSKEFINKFEINLDNAIKELKTKENMIKKCLQISV